LGDQSQPKFLKTKQFVQQAAELDRVGLLERCRQSLYLLTLILCNKEPCRHSEHARAVNFDWIVVGIKHFVVVCVFYYSTSIAVWASAVNQIAIFLEKVCALFSTTYTELLI
jgi:hypothetical protein